MSPLSIVRILHNALSYHRRKIYMEHNAYIIRRSLTISTEYHK